MKKENPDWRGRWWLPETPGQVVPGTLFRKRLPALELELLGAFDYCFGLRDFSRSPLIAHGVSTGGEELTIEIGAETSLGTSSFGRRKKYGVWRAISGGHFESMDPLVASVTCSLELRSMNGSDESIGDGSNTFSYFPDGFRSGLTTRNPNRFCSPS